MGIFDEYKAVGPSWNLDPRVCAVIGVQATILLMELIEHAEQDTWFPSNRAEVAVITGITSKLQRSYEKILIDAALLKIEIRTSGATKTNWYYFRHGNMLSFIEDPSAYMKQRKLLQEATF